MRKSDSGFDHAAQLANDFAHTIAQTFAGPSWKYVVASVGGVVTWLLPTADHQSLFVACAAALGMDTVTGMVASIKAGKPLSSARFARVLYKIIGYVSVIFVAKLLRYFPGLEQFHLPAMLAAMWLILATEALSILENVNKLGVVLPQFLRRMLEDQVSKHSEQVPEVSP